MGKTIIQKIFEAHSKSTANIDEIIDVTVDVRVARDFGGANVVKHLEENNLSIDDPKKTFFTFDCNPSGSDQKYAENQQKCRIFARNHGIKVYDINRGIGTHILIDEGLAYPGSTAVSTDSHANILGAVGAFGQGMGDLDIAAAWSKGKVWFKVPESVKLLFRNNFPPGLYAKDIVFNLLSIFGPDRLLGCSVELCGDAIEKLTVDDRITIASMATEMGAVTILIPPNNEVIRYCESRACKRITPVYADEDASYNNTYELNAADFRHMVSRPGKPHDVVPVDEVKGIKIDSAFIGSCTNGRFQDLQTAAEILKGRKVAPGVILKIVPSTDRIWNLCLEEGLIEIFKDARAMVSNPGCAGCAAGQVGQNGPGEVTISSGNRNFPGKQGKGDVYLASPAVIAASSIAGYITTPDDIPDEPAVFMPENNSASITLPPKKKVQEKPVEVEGRAWIIGRDNIDTDKIYHNKHLAITDIAEMGKYAFGNLEGYEDFAGKAKPGDVVFSGKNFGSGSSRQQAVDCFKVLGIQAIIAESFGSIYERNAINAALPILISDQISQLELRNGQRVRINYQTGEIRNLMNNKTIQAKGFSEVQMEIYRNGGLF